MKKIIITLMLIVITNLSFGQYQQYEQYITPFLSDSIQSGYFYLNQPNNIQAGQLYQTYRMNAPDLNNNMVLIDMHVDSLVGLTHYKYEQTYMDIPIEGAGCIEHYNTDGSLLFLNGKFADSIKRSHKPKFDEETAIRILVKELSRNEEIQFAWEDSDWEQQIRLDEADSNATWFPEAELVWAIDTMKNMQVVIPGSRYSLAYKIFIKTLVPYDSKVFYVNAQNGSILKSKSKHIHDGPADIYGYGSQIIDTRWKGGFTQAHILHANDNTRDIHTKKNPNGETAWWLLSNITSNNDIWGNTSLTETSTHYHVTRSWDYFRQTFGRAGFDGVSKGIRVRTQWETGSQPNAYYLYDENTNSPPELVFGKSLSNWDMGMDPSIVGHEFTHGVTNHTSNLEYFAESGALNESFSDIFGIVIQAIMLDGGSTDWILGNHVPDLPLRSLEVPKDYGQHWNGSAIQSGQPDTYQGDYWCENCPVNNGGVHINSGVQNKWFYILSNGDSGWNDSNDYYNVSGIGMNRAATIAYWALTSILQNSSQYSDSRQATITAAKMLFGECSVEHQATIDAWYAVGIGNLNDCDYTLSNDDIFSLDEEVLIYPNPTNNNLNIEVPNRIDNQILIYDATGKVAESFSSKNLVFTKDVSHLSNGVYYINFTINDNPIRRRFVVQK